MVDNFYSRPGDWGVDRRQALTILGGTVLGGLAGCTSDDDSGQGNIEGTAPDAEETTTETTADSETTEEETTEEETTTEAGEAEVAIGEGTFGVADFGYSEYPYYEVELTNEGNAPSGIIELVVDWFDENDEYIDDTLEELVSLKAGTTWIARSYYIGDKDEVASAEASGNYNMALPEWPEGLEVTSSKLLTGGENVKVRATVENNTGEMVDYVAFYGKLFDTDGNVLGQVWTNETELADGSTWQAEREWDDEERAKLAKDYEVVLEGNIY